MRTASLIPKKLKVFWAIQKYHASSRAQDRAFKLSRQDTSQHRKTALFMLIATAIYLSIEMAFNARLLDVVGAMEGHDKTESIEVYGRLISGAAVALLILGLFLKGAATKMYDRRCYIVCSLIPIVVCCGGAMMLVYHAEKWLIDGMVERSTGEERRRAAVLVPISRLLKQGDLGDENLTLTSEDYATAQGKTFVATFPLLSVYHPDLFKVVDKKINPIFRAYSEDLRKHSDGFFDSYKKSIETLTEQYNGPYTKANQTFKNVTGFPVIQNQNTAWKEYTDKLSQRRRNLNPNNVPKGHWNTVRAEVRAMGVPVNDGWAPSDRAGFNAAIRKKVTDEALREFHSQSIKELDLTQPLDPQLDKEAFFQHPAVLNKWKSTLKVPLKIPVRVGLTSAMFEKEVYGPTVDDDVRVMMERNYADARDYGPRGRHRQTGEDAYRALIVPPIALVFSLIGAMVHIFKVFLYARKSFSVVSARMTLCAFLIYLGVMIYVPLMVNNNVTNQVLFKKLETTTQENVGGFSGLIISYGIRWVAQFQPYFYPLNEFVRTKILFSPQFDGKIKEKNKTNESNKLNISIHI